MSFACGNGLCPCDFCIQKLGDVYRCSGRIGAKPRYIWMPDRTHQVVLNNVQALRAHIVKHILEGDTIITNPFGVLTEQQEE